MRYWAYVTIAQQQISTVHTFLSPQWGCPLSGEDHYDPAEFKFHVCIQGPDGTCKGLPLGGEISTRKP